MFIQYSLYTSCHWEDRAVRKLIGDGKLAARLKGTEDRSAEADQECPICFLQYRACNVTKCCSAFICTECYLQVRPQKEKATACPFCNNSKLAVTVAKKMDATAIAERDAEEQMVISAKLRDRSGSSSTTTTPEDQELLEQAPAVSQFGSSLAQNERVAILRARSESIASESSCGDVVASLVMTPDERRALEEEMRAQHNHPLSMRLEAEEAERRLNNDREYYRAQTGRLRELRARRELLHGSMASVNGSGTGGVRASASAAAGAAAASRRRPRGTTNRSGRDWNRIVDAFESNGSGAIQSLDDLVVLEAAIMLSMEEGARRHDDSGSEEEEQDDAGQASASLDADRHASEGYPLARTRPGRPQNEEDTSTDLNQQVQSLVRGIRQRSRGGSSSRSSGARGVAADMSLDTAAMWMHGISEEEQIAMAIAASLEPSPHSSEPVSGDDDTGGVNTTTAAVADAATEISTTEPQFAEASTAGHDGSEETSVPEAVESPLKAPESTVLPTEAVDTPSEEVERTALVSEAVDVTSDEVGSSAPACETVTMPSEGTELAALPATETVHHDSSLEDAETKALATENAGLPARAVEMGAPATESVEIPAQVTETDDVCVSEEIPAPSMEEILGSTDAYDDAADAEASSSQDVTPESGSTLVEA